QDLRLTALALAALQHRRELLDVGGAAREEHVEQALELGRMELRLGLSLRALVPARPEVEDRVGVDVVDARVALLGEARLSVLARRLRIEVLLEPVDVASAPGPGEAVAAEGAPLGVVGIVRRMPVADVDDVEEPVLIAGKTCADRRVQEEAEGTALEHF